MEDFADKLLSRLDELEAEHKKKLDALHDARVALSESQQAISLLHADEVPAAQENQQPLRDKVTEAEIALREKPADRPHDSLVIDALLDVLRGK